MLTERPMDRVHIYEMVRRRTASAGFKGQARLPCVPRDRITAYLEAGGTLENAQAMAAHESPRATKLYDRTGDEITLDEVEQITILTYFNQEMMSSFRTEDRIASAKGDDRIADH